MIDHHYIQPPGGEMTRLCQFRRTAPRLRLARRRRRRLQPLSQAARTAAHPLVAAAVAAGPPLARASTAERVLTRSLSRALSPAHATIPGWQERATALGLDGDLMKWTEEDWRAILRAGGETWVPISRTA